MIASEIYKLIEIRYPLEKYIVVSECKTGASWISNSCLRLDAWIMARSWAHPRFIGIEIKVSRSDFINDTKWPLYLPYCSEFYFVAPAKVMSVNEVPADAGYLEVSKNCKKLYIRKKAPYRDIEIPQSLLLYILMCRTQITGDLYNNKPSHVIWRERLKQAQANKKLGWTLSHIISERVKKEVAEIRLKNNELYRENERLLHIKKWLDEHNIKLTDVTHYSGVNSRFEELISGVPVNFKSNLSQLHKDVETLLNHLT